jgi:hypothetical protein
MDKFKEQKWHYYIDLEVDSENDIVDYEEERAIKENFLKS